MSGVVVRTTSAMVLPVPATEVPLAPGVAWLTPVPTPCPTTVPLVLTTPPTAEGTSMMEETRGPVAVVPMVAALWLL